MPITLDVSEATAEQVSAGGKLALRDGEGVMLAVLHVEDIWRPDREAEAQAVFGTTNTEHPGVAQLLTRSEPVYVGGRLAGLQPVVHYDYKRLRHTPAELRSAHRRPASYRLQRPTGSVPRHQEPQHAAAGSARHWACSLPHRDQTPGHDYQGAHRAAGRRLSCLSTWGQRVGRRRAFGRQLEVDVGPSGALLLSVSDDGTLHSPTTPVASPGPARRAGPRQPQPPPF